jgi:hypothetical protein
VGGFLRILIYGKIGLAHDAAMLSTQAWVIIMKRIWLKPLAMKRLF